jgi:cytochrome c-type biogenesis protein CcmH
VSTHGHDRTVRGPVNGTAIDRRVFLLGAAGFGGALLANGLGAQQVQPNSAPMEQDAYRPTIRPPKPDATPQLTDDQRDALEHRIKCQCGCILDVYTCRTTDFACQVSPAMHRDVLRLVAGGYGAEEILAAFVETYGEVAMTEPKKEGFNWAGYFAPSVALVTGAIVLTVMLRKWAAESKQGADARAAAAVGVPGSSVAGMSTDDVARLERALREDA